MLRSQRILIVVGSLLLAVMLHVLLCDWSYRRPWQAEVGKRIFTYRHANPLPVGSGGYATTAYTGLAADDGVDRSDAVVFGVVLPLAVLLANAYLLLGWRHAVRISRGQCVKCGYDLRGDLEHGCPECGWNRKEEGAPAGERSESAVRM